MADAKITKKPSQDVQNLSVPKRTSGRIFQVSWKVPDRMKNGKYNDRATSLPYQWELHFAGDGVWKATGTGGIGDTSKQVNIANFPHKIGKPARNVNRSDFYPLHPTRFLYTVGFRIWGQNNKPGKSKGVYQPRWFEYPRAPVFSNIEHNADTGEVSARLRTDAGNDYKERYDTHYMIIVHDSRSGVKDDVTDATTTSTDTVVRKDVARRFSIKPGEYITVTFRAWSRGYRGATQGKDAVHVIAFPNKPTVSYQKPKSTDNDAKLIVNVGTNHDATKAPVTGVQLEMLRSVDITKAADAKASTDWEALDVVDDAQCTALVADIEDIRPERGSWTWLRVKSWHDIKEVYYTNSEPMLIKELYRDIAAGSADVQNPVPSADGNSASVEVFWDKGDDEADGTELSWSTDEDAWISTKRPNTFTFDNTWGETIPGATGDMWRKKATVVIKELDNAPAYVRARRYSDEESGRVFGTYSPTLYVSPTEAPAAAALSAPYYVAEGSSAVFSWGFNSTGKQDEWRLMAADGTTIATGTDAYTTHSVDYERLAGVAENASFTQKLAGTGSVVLSAVSGTSIVVRSPEQAWENSFSVDADGSFTVEYPDGEHTFTWTAATHTLTYDLPDDFFAEAVYSPSNMAGVVSVYVAVSTGGRWVESPAQTVRLFEAPSLVLTAPSTLTAQPFAFTLETDVATTEAVVRVFSHGSGGESPDGRDNSQTDGDTVWSDAFNPVWIYDSTNEVYTCEVVVPNGSDFRNGATYEVEALLTDTATGLDSEQQTAEFSVDWGENVAQAPPDSITVTPSTVTDDDGDVRRITTIDLVAPENEQESSVYDVYRLTADGAALIATGRDMNETIVDGFAPFGEGETAYRVVTRTADGDTEWADYSYTFEAYCLRFDFGGDYLEFPYTVNYQNRFTKDFERNRKMSGADDGFWNQGTERAANLSTDPIVFDSPAQIEKIYALARYAGAVLVRTPDGMCYSANVNVSGLEGSTTVKAIAVSFEAEEIELTDEFRIPPAETAETGGE